MIKTVMLDWDPLETAPRKEGVRKDRKIRVNAFIQARTTSTRLPNKIYRQLNGAPLIYHTLARAKVASLIDDVIVVSPHPLPDLPEGIKEFIYDGPENDVLGRFVAALRIHPCDYVVRLTSDCPLLDPWIIDMVIAKSIGSDYGSNVLIDTFPDGLDVEVISAMTLGEMDRNVRGPYDREHVTSWIRNNQSVQAAMKIVSVQSFKDYSYLKLSVDTEEDLERLKQLEATHG